MRTHIDSEESPNLIKLGCEKRVAYELNKNKNILKMFVDLCKLKILFLIDHKHKK